MLAKGRGKQKELGALQAQSENKVKDANGMDAHGM